MHKATIAHTRLANEIWRALIFYKSKGIFFDGSGDRAIVECHMDADLEGGNYDRSTTCVQWRISGGIFQQTVKLQPTVALSTFEAEIHALATAVQEAEFIRGVMNELGFPQKNPTKIFCDNKSTVDWANGIGKISGRRNVRHLELRYSRIREAGKQLLVKVIHVSGKENPADLRTKIVSPAVFRKLVANVIG